MWTTSDVKRDRKGSVVYRTPIWRTEAATELIKRCNLSINKTRCYKEASERGTARVKLNCSFEIGFQPLLTIFIKLQLNTPDLS